jgi:23S rRNA (pseudouridine1915-N3)-methyltransferase
MRGTLAGAVADYEERTRRYWKLEIVEVGAGARGRDPSPERVMEAEAGRLLARLPADHEVIALTRAGRAMDSRRLARYLGERAVRSVPGVAFVLGGAYGLGEEVLARAARRLSLSAMTLPHEMARLVLVEQLYRAGTILRGEPYHKGD